MSTINAQRFTNPGDGITALFLDRTMRTLYARSTTSAGTHSILAFQKNLPTGVLRYFGTTDHPGQPIRARGPGFIGNNQYAYTAVCYDPWFAAQRINDGISLEGTLSPFSINPVIPSNPTGNYCAFTSAPDSANNLAVALFLWQNGNAGPSQLAVYTADSSGNLTTNSTAANMPFTVVDGPYRMSVSPGGNLLAVAGDNGLQVFHFNGSNPITPYTKRLAWSNYDLAWDAHKHLYAIDKGGLHVWRITPTFWTHASPYPLSGPVAITVLSK
jgi:hypothetical protein